MFNPGEEWAKIRKAQKKSSRIIGYNHEDLSLKLKNSRAECRKSSQLCDEAVQNYTEKVRLLGAEFREKVASNASALELRIANLKNSIDNIPISVEEVRVLSTEELKNRITNAQQPLHQECVDKFEDSLKLSKFSEAQFLLGFGDVGTFSRSCGAMVDYNNRIIFMHDYPDFISILKIMHLTASFYHKTVKPASHIDCQLEVSPCITTVDDIESVISDVFMNNVAYGDKSEQYQSLVSTLGKVGMCNQKLIDTAKVAKSAGEALL